MGIQGLLPLLKSIMVPIHIKDLEGCSVAVDTYSWLHKGALSCSKDLCKGHPTSKHISYCMHRVNLLRHHGIKPVLVFDGGHLPMKSEQENKRARSRKENFARALEHESGGNKAAAYECYSKAVDITPSIAYELIQVLKQENVAYVVAPYEADAQMTFLAVNKLVDAVITEDSDLIPFGCPRIIYKMDKFGQGLEFCSSRLQQNKDLNFTGFTKQMFLEMCILSGCDYLQSLPGMGLKRAYALVKKFKSYDKVIKHLMYSNVAVPPLYEDFFWKALLTFQHQRVYDPITEDIVHLSDITDNTGENTDFLGPSISQNMAKGIATGDLDPFTKLPFQGKCVTSVSMLDDSNRPLIKNVEGESKKIDLPIQKNLLTNYFCFTSLEAKRKFVVPRVTSKHPETRSEVHTHRDNIEAVFAHNADCSSPVLSFTGPEIVDSTKDSVFNDVVAAKSSVSSELAHGSNNRENDLQSLQCSFNQARHSIYPCMVVNKERQRQMISNTVNSKMRIEQNNVTVRSSYFQKKSVEANGPGNKDGEFFVKDIDPTARSLSTIYQRESKSASDRSEGQTIFEDRDPILLSPIKSVKTTDHTSTNGQTLMSAAAAADTRASTIPLQEGKSAKNAAQQTRTESRKVVVRSPYFMQKIGKENDQDTKSCPPKDVATATYENTINGVCNKYYKGTDSKRKLDDNVETELLARKCLRTNGSLPIQSTGTLDPEDSVVTTNEQDKFGCNISHIDRYSNIAEKSIEKFASMISSFRYTSGSRASGLRAPLKDVQNNCTKSSTSNRKEAADLSKFAYVPTNQRRFLASRR